MYFLKIIQHIDISSDQRNEIIRIKSIAWQYNYKKHKIWMDENLKGCDFHLLLASENNALVAYLNIINIKLNIDNSIFDAFGIGNVCSIEKSKGFGSELMKQSNLFIKEKNKIGILFCNHNLVTFYEKCGWKVIEKQHLNLSFDNNKIESMIFNYNLKFHQLYYDGKEF